MKNKEILLNDRCKISLNNIVLFMRTSYKNYDLLTNTVKDILEWSIDLGKYIDISFGYKKKSLIITKPFKVIFSQEYIEYILKQSEESFMEIDEGIYLHRDRYKGYNIEKRKQKKFKNVVGKNYIINLKNAGGLSRPRMILTDCNMIFSCTNKDE